MKSSCCLRFDADEKLVDRRKVPPNSQDTAFEDLRRRPPRSFREADFLGVGEIVLLRLGVTPPRARTTFSEYRLDYFATSRLLG